VAVRVAAAEADIVRDDDDDGEVASADVC